MDILQYLIALLKTRKQIGVEGLGTFYKKKTPGRYDAQTHSFLPPSYVLEFTTDILENNNLSEYIQNQRGISQDSAKYFIHQFVEEVQKQLQQGEYTLNNLGTFNSLHHQLIFVPSQEINTGFDFFALPAVNAAVKQTQSQQEITEETLDAAVEGSAKVTDEPHVEQVQVPEFEQEMSKVPAAKDEISATEVDETLAQETSVKEEIPEERTTEHAHEHLEQLNDGSEAETASEEVNEAIEEKDVEELEVTATTPENDTTDLEVFEEITEVNAENPTNQTTFTNNETDTWNFDDENVVSTDDTESKNNPEDLDETISAANANEAEKKDAIKLNSTTKEWDFDNIDNKEENILIGEFDDELAQEELPEEKHGMPLYQKLTIGLLVLVVVFAALYFLKPEIFESFKRDTTNPDQKIAVPIERSNLKTQQDSISFADSIMQNAEKAGLDVQPAKDTIKVTTTKTEVKPTLTFDIIIASFATTAKAEDYVNRMKKKGYDAKISSMPGKRKNISIASYNHPDSAEKHLAKFRKQFNNKEIYAQPIKNK